MTVTRGWLILMVLAGFAACAKLNLSGSGPIPTPSTYPTATPTTGPTPGACNTPSSDANSVLVAMSNAIGPTSVSPYGVVNGYSVVENGEFPGQAMLIDRWLSPHGVAAITTKNSLQFVNVDGGAQHSAVGFKGEAFPQTPYTFAKSASSPVGTAVSATSLWSTGRVGAFVGSQPCYSQTFSLPAGTFYFGDLDYYNLSNFRDVLIVVTPQLTR